MGRPRSVLSGSAGLLLMLLGAPALAQDDAAIEQLIAESETPADAVALAREQMAQGDNSAAAATLERALLENPNAHDARLLYATALCRIGDAQGARIEMAKLDRQDIDDGLWRAADEACGGGLRHPLPADRSADGAGLSGDVYAGLAYDRDAGGAVILQTDFLAGGKRKDGLSMIAGGQANWRSQGYASGGGLYAGGALAVKHDVSGPNLDYDIGELRLGYGNAAGATGWEIGPVLRHVRLFGDPYVTEYGGQGELLFGNARAHRVRLRGELVQQDYKDGVPGNSGDGIKADLSLAYETSLGGKGFATLGLGGELKNARERLFSYRGGRLFGSLYRPFANRHYLGLQGTLRYIDFRDAYVGLDRKDTRAFARLAYGIPIGDGGLFGEGALSYTYRKVSTDGFADFRTYRSPGAELRLIWRF